MAAEVDPVSVWSPTLDSCADEDDNAGADEQIGCRPSGSDSSTSAPSWSFRNGVLGRCGEWDWASSLDSSMRSTDLTNNVVSVLVRDRPCRDVYSLAVLDLLVKPNAGDYSRDTERMRIFTRSGV